MTKVTAGVLAGILLGALYGLYNTRGDWSGPVVSASLLGRSAQGIINGVLAAYANKGQTPLWRGALWGILVGLGLGVLDAVWPPRRRNATSARAPTDSPSRTPPPLLSPPPRACTVPARSTSAPRPSPAAP